MISPLRQHLPAAALCGLWLIAGSLWISRPGLQSDEALFSMGLYYPQGAGWSIVVFGTEIPLMQMSYLGSLKAWLYAPLFAIWAPSAASVRIPMVLAGAATLWLVYLLMRRCASPLAAVFALALLALDPTLVWTTRCDWGPAALQHLLAAAGVYAFVRHRPVVGAFLFGLALWDKTVFVWTLSGLALATILVLHSRIREYITPRAAVLALAAFLTGALPLIAYNLRFSGQTARQTVGLSIAEAPAKIRPLIRSLDGSALFGYLVRDEFRGPRFTLTALLLAAAILAAPWWWRTRARRPALFFLLVWTTSWLAMAATAGGGESAHHLVLLWPWPHCFLAVVLAEAPRRLGTVAAAAALISSGMVTANYYAMLVRRGADPPWSEAIYRLHLVVSHTPATRVYVTDWGILDQLRLLSRGSLPIHPDAGLPPRVDDPMAVYVGHTDAYQAFDAINAKVEAAAASATPVPFRKFPLATVRDPQGKAVFQVYRLVPGR